jgi:hypothetical protein
MELLVDDNNLPQKEIRIYNIEKPNYGTKINICNSKKISNNEEDYIFGPYVYEDYIAWSTNNNCYLWYKDSRIKLPYDCNILDLNDNNLFFQNPKTGEYFLYDINIKKILKVKLPTQTGTLINYDNGNFSYNYNKSLYYLSKYTARKISSIEDDSWFSLSSVHEGKITWTDKDSEGYHQIFFYNGEKIIQITKNEKNSYPKIFDGKIVWNRLVNNHDIVYFFNGKNIQQLTNENTYSLSPKLYNTTIAWTQLINNNWEIAYWNGNEIIQITNNNMRDTSVDIYNNRVAWTQSNSSNKIHSVYTCIIEENNTIKPPSGKHIYTYDFVNDTIYSFNPSQAKPFTAGNIISEVLNLKVALNKFSKPVDIYLAIALNKISNKIFFINPSNELKKSLIPWKINNTSKIQNVSLFGEINKKLLPKGIYTLYLLVVPSGATDMNNSYLWITNFKI